MVAAAISVVLALWGVPQAGLGAAPAAVVFIGVIALLAGGALAVRFRREGIVRDGDVLSQALDLDPDALAALSPDGGPLFVNIAFDRRFSPSREPPLVRIAAALADDPEVAGPVRPVAWGRSGGRRGAGVAPAACPQCPTHNTV